MPKAFIGKKLKLLSGFLRIQDYFTFLTLCLKGKIIFNHKLRRKENSPLYIYNSKIHKISIEDSKI